MSSETSAYTGVAPRLIITLEEATKLKGVVKTLSPGETPHALRLNRNASVPEFTATPYCVLFSLLIFFSSSSICLDCST